MANLPQFKGGDILVDRHGNVFLLLHDVRYDTPASMMGITIAYAEIEILLKSPLTPDISITRLLAGDFNRCKKMTYPEAERRNGAVQVLYGKKA